MGLHSRHRKFSILSIDEEHLPELLPWYGKTSITMFDAYGLGIRQDLYGDKRFVPWFNAPPNTMQRLNFFCYMSAAKPAVILNKVKAFTHDDTYLPLDGWQDDMSLQ